MSAAAHRRIGLRWWLAGLGLLVVAAVGLVAVLSGFLVPTLADGEAQFRQGRVAAARDTAQARVRWNPADGGAWNLLGRIEAQAGNHAAAILAFEQAIAHLKRNGSARSAQAMCFLAAGRLAEAEVALVALHAEQPDDESVRTELQWLFFNQLRERELEQLLESDLVRQPGNFQLAYHLLYASQRRPVAQEALGFLERCNTQSPHQPAVELALGRCYWKLGDPQRARALLEPAWQRLHSLESALVLAEFLMDQGDFTAADKVLLIPTGNETDAGKEDDRWWWLRSERALQQNDLPTALTAITAAVRLRPGEVRYVNSQATILQAMQQQDQAQAARKRAEELAAVDRELYIMVSRGDLERPTPAICRTLARLCKVQGKTVQAKTWELLATRRG